MSEFLVSAVLSFVIMVVIFFLTTLKISIHAVRKGKDDKIKTRVTAWFGLIQFNSEVPIVKFAENFSGTVYQMEMESPNKKLDETTFKVKPFEAFQLIHRLQNWIHDIYGLHFIAKLFLKDVYLEKLEWKSVIGTGDASETGILTGICWGVKSSLIGFITSYLELRTIPRIYVQPFYQDKKLESDFSCMFRFRIGNAILAGIRILINLKKRRDMKWQNTQFRA